MIAFLILSWSIFNVPEVTSTNTGTPPRKTTAFAVEVNVNEGIMTSSPDLISHKIEAISKAAVPELVR